MKKWNHYTCDTCGKITIARHDDEGVTPFMIPCYAGAEITEKGRFPACQGTAKSCFFAGDQSDEQTPHIIFYRPPILDAIKAINKEPKRERAWWKEHYSKGGSLMKFPGKETQ